MKKQLTPNKVNHENYVRDNNVDKSESEENENTKLKIKQEKEEEKDRFSETHET